jgi:signal transduction histidine kinase
MAIEQILQQIPFFHDLPAEQLEKLVDKGQRVSMETGQIVCAEGELSDSMYVLLDGKVCVYRHDEAGSRIDLRGFVSGDFFGELALVDNKPRSATVACLTPCDLFILEQATFREILATNPAVTYNVLTALANRWREQIERTYQGELAKQALEAEAEIERHRTLTQMVAGVAHELNTPLGITNTAVDMIGKRINRPEVAALFEGTPQTRQLLDNILEATGLAQRNIERAHKLIQDFKKISVYQLVDTPQTEELAALVESTVALFRINARLAKLNIEIEDRLLPKQEWLGYPGYLTQVLLNLLTNVERYAYDPAVGGQVDIVLTGDDTAYTPTFTVTVRDFGRGIPLEEQDKVFEPFYTTGRAKGGTGLGLAIVHNIVTIALKGSIHLQSQPGQGTAFQITFPQRVD